MTPQCTILRGDCLDTLQTLEPGSIHCCVTSPPYWGLRDYGAAGQIGLEANVESFVLKMVVVFRLVHRALRDDGTLWLNLGDTYAGSRGASGRQGKTGAMAGRTASRQRQIAAAAKNSVAEHTFGVRDKSLVGVPWRVALALQADGWILRQDIIWHKPNPMPESVADRCTKAHEYLFLLAKSRHYYWDAKAMQEDGVIPAGTKAAKGSKERFETPGVNSRPPEYKIYTGKRNRRSVWTVQCRPFKGAHFATFPPGLIEPCVLAGCPVGGTVLDPFGGSGTTGMVALQHGRSAVMCEINPDYCRMIEERTRITPGLPIA